MNNEERLAVKVLHTVNGRDMDTKRIPLPLLSEVVMNISAKSKQLQIACRTIEEEALKIGYGTVKDVQPCDHKAIREFVLGNFVHIEYIIMQIEDEMYRINSTLL